MFKFATNKFSSSNSGSGANSNGSNPAASSSTSTTPSGHNHRSLISNVSHNANKLLSAHLDSGDSSALSKRRQLQKDLFAFNKIADKGFPSKPSAMDYDKKLKMLAIGKLFEIKMRIIVRE